MLITHVFSAILTLTVCAYSYFKPTRSIQKALYLSSGLSIVSGVWLSLSPGYLTGTTCVKLGVYLLIITLAQYKLSQSLKLVAGEKARREII
jgi:hypothetical protein